MVSGNKKMNKKQAKQLLEKFKEQQKLNFELFKKEIKVIVKNMDYKEELMSLGLSIYLTKRDIKGLNEQEKIMNLQELKPINTNIKKTKK